MKMYMARLGKIVPVDNIERTTEKQVVFDNGRRQSIFSQYDCFFETFEEAKEFLIEKATEKVQDLGYRIECAEIELQDVNLLTEK